MVAKIKELLGSRKFWLGIIGAVLTYINSQLHILNDVQMASVLSMIGVVVVGQGMVDASKQK